jgi:hypothetical protein
MKKLALLFFAAVALADTPPPNTVKAKMYSGDGNTAVGVTGSSMNANVTNSVAVTGTFWQATQPVSLTTLPALTAGSAIVGKVGIDQTTPGTTNGVQINAALPAGSNAIGSVSINGTVPVSGTITTTNSANGNTGSAVPTQATQVGGSDGTSLRALKVSAAGILAVDGSASTQPVSAVSLPLPTGAATAAKQPALGTAGSSSSDVISIQGISGMTAVKVDGSGVTQPISASALPLPSGAATASNQTSVQGSASGGSAGSLSLLSGGIYNSAAPTLTNGQQVSLQLNSSGSMKVDGSAVTQPVSGTITGSGNFTVVQPTGSNLHVQVDSAPTTAVSQSGTWTVNSKPATPTALTVKAAAITIGTSAVRLTNDGSAPPSTRALLVAQLSSASTANCYMGPSSVTSSGSSRGIQMFAGQSFSFNNDAGDYYAICDSAAQTFLITEQE